MNEFKETTLEEFQKLVIKVDDLRREFLDRGFGATQVLLKRVAQQAGWEIAAKLESNNSKKVTDK